MEKKQQNSEPLYCGVCDGCKRVYRNIPKSATNLQCDYEGRDSARFISCDAIISYDPYHNRYRLCNGFVELELQQDD